MMDKAEELAREILKPCPFCGGKAIMNSDGEEWSTFIGCENPACIACRHTKVVAYSSQKHAIKAWNDRTSEDKARQEQKEKDAEININRAREYGALSKIGKALIDSANEIRNG